MNSFDEQALKVSRTKFNANLLRVLCEAENPPVQSLDNGPGHVLLKDGTMAIIVRPSDYQEDALQTLVKKLNFPGLQLKRNNPYEKGSPNVLHTEDYLKREKPYKEPGRGADMFLIGGVDGERLTNALIKAIIDKSQKLTAGTLDIVEQSGALSR